MKRILRFLPIAAIMLSCAFSFTACGDDDNDSDDDIVNNGNGNNGGNNGDNLVTSNDRLPKSVGNLIFNYDENNKLTSITENYRGDIKVSYNPLTFTYSYKENDSDYQMEDNKVTVSNIKLNANGHVTSCSFNSSYYYKYSDTYESEEGEEKATGKITFKYNGTRLVNATLNGSANTLYNEGGETFKRNYNINRNIAYNWENGNLKSIVANINNTAGAMYYNKLNSTVSFKYGEKQNESAQFTHGYTEPLAYIFNEEMFAGLIHMNLLGEAPVNFPINATVTQKEEESYNGEKYNNELTATENYSDYTIDEKGYLVSYYTEGNYEYDEDYYGGSSYSYTTYYEYADNGNTPNSAPAKMRVTKEANKKRAKGFFNKRK